MKKTFAALTLTLSAFVATSAFAAENNFAKRQAILTERLKSGIENGGITPKEAAVLTEQLVKVQVMQKKFMSDGILTTRESNILTRNLDQVSANIYKEKGDWQRN